MNTQTYHITLATDDNYIPLVACTICSVLKNIPSEVQVHFHLLTNRVSGENLKRIEQQVQGRGSLAVYDVADLAKRLSVPVPSTIAITSYARLFLPSLIPATVDRILYLDCDTIVASSLSELFSTDFQGNLVAGVLDTLPDNKAKLNIGLPASAPYINAGVLFINLSGWRKEHIQQKFLDFLIERKGRVHHHDQGIINAVLDKRKLILPPHYNLTSNYFSHPYRLLQKTNTPFYTPEEIEAARKHPAILHFTEGFLNRPWIAGSKHPYRQLFLHYRAQTPWRNAPLLPDRRSIAARILAFEFLHGPYFLYKFTADTLQYLSDALRK